MHKSHILIIEARFYPDITDELAAGAVTVLEEAGIEHERIAVPGVFEIPSAITCALAARDMRYSARFAGFIALGCVIRGETSHYDHVCGESIRGLMDLCLKHGLALGNGILTVENREQAQLRADRNGGDKGGMAARACLKMIHLRQEFGLEQY